MRRFVVCGVGALAVAGAVVGTMWALSITVRPSPDPDAARPVTLATVEAGAVEERIPVRITAEWQSTLAGRNGASGVVTSVELDANSESQTGDVAYTVDLRPVVLAGGDVPSFRDLSKGLTGPDVRQLQEMLLDTGHLRGVADGIFGDATGRAVAEWHRQLGLAPSGKVAPDELIFVPTLPAPLSVDPAIISVGIAVTGGEPGVVQTSTAPTLRSSVSADVASNVPIGSSVRVESDASTWEGHVDAIASTDDGSWVAEIASSKDGSPSAPFPGIPDSEGRAQFRGQIVATPRTEGLVIPVAAIATAEGRTFVVDEAGRRRFVEVVQSAGGISVVKGLPSGARVRVPDGRH